MDPYIHTPPRFSVPMDDPQKDILDSIEALVPLAMKEHGDFADLLRGTAGIIRAARAANPNFG